MSSRQETIDAITAFYKQIIRHPYLDDTTLKIPPISGWDTINSDSLRSQGKSDDVIEFLRHLPYLEADGEYDRVLVEHDTVSIAYTQRSASPIMMEQVTPLPSHCFYLTEGIDREGYSLILDTERGTITAYSVLGYEISPDVSVEEYGNLPSTEQWRAHRTLPAAELLHLWTMKYARLVNMLVPNLISQPATGTFLSRTDNRLESERLAQETGPFEEWRPNIQNLLVGIEDESLRRYRTACWQHIADVYNCHLRHGWSDTFDKAACMAEVVEMERQAKIEEKRFLDANNPDAALFDD